jgi:HNH endonuclease
VRQFVAQRAGYRCEYCLLSEDDSYSPHQIDHIISRKHGGSSDSGNLAYACLRCNAWKGSDIGSLDETGAFVSLFHPRRQAWYEHFVFRGAIIHPLTSVGLVTARLLKFNIEKRMAERQTLFSAGRYTRRP